MSDAELLAQWLAGPGARPTAEDVARWKRLDCPRYASVDEAMDEAQRQIEKWRTTLDWLAER